MPYPINTSEISRLTGATRETVLKKVGSLTPVPGVGMEKLYDSKAALRCIFLGDGNAITPQDRLADKRTEEIELNMEVTRGERIPLDDVAEHNAEVLQNVAGIFKANENKKLTAELIQEIFAEFRRMDEVLAEYRRKVGTTGEQHPIEDPAFQ